MDVLPEDRSLLPKFNSDVCKRHLFFSNLTEDVYQVLTDTFTMVLQESSDFSPFRKRTRVSHSSLLPSLSRNQKQCFKVPFSVHFSSFACQSFYDSILFLFKGAYLKLSVRAKGTTVRQDLTGTVFLISDFQKFILRIQTFYKTKKEVQYDITFFLILSVSTSLASLSKCVMY